MSTEHANTCPRCGAPLEGARDHADEASGPVVCPACLLIDAAPREGDGPALPGLPSIADVNSALEAYEVQTTLGHGGAGSVFRARHVKLDRLVAIKVLRPLPGASPADEVAFAERFEREARVLAKLDHPHIVRIYDFGRATSSAPGVEPFFYLVLEYVEGASLRDLLEAGRLTAREVLDFVPQVCEALQAAHDVGVVHRDIKPENILVDSSGHVRIADFGLAKIVGTEPTAYGLTRTDQVMGTLHYMAPEQMRSAGSVDHRADLYSLGVVVYEMLTGELPIGRFGPPSKKQGEAKSLDSVVLRALENDPNARFQEAKDMRSAMRVSDRAMPVNVPAHPSDVRRRKRRVYRKRRIEGRAARIRHSGSLESTAAVIPDARARSLVVFGLLFATMWMEWFVVYQSITSFGTRGGFEANGFNGSISIGILEYPIWFIALAYAVACGLRLKQLRDPVFGYLFPWVLTLFGLGSTALLVAVGWISEDLSIRGGLVVAFVALLASSMIDVAEYLKAKQTAQRRMRHGDDDDSQLTAQRV